MAQSRSLLLSEDQPVMWCRVALYGYMAMYRRREYRLRELLLAAVTAIAQLLGREMLLSATRLTL